MLKHGDDKKVNKITGISWWSECTIYLSSVSVISISNKFTSECNRQSHKETKCISMLHLSLSLSCQMTRSGERRLSLAGWHKLTSSLGINLTSLTLLLISQRFVVSKMATLRARRRIRSRFKSEDGFFLFQPAQTDCWTPSASCLKGSALAFFPRKQLGRDVRLATHFYVVPMLICLTLPPPHTSSWQGAVLDTWTLAGDIA
jgi:hypothetical protein